MSTPNPIVFTPLVKGFSWQNSTTAEGGAPLPAGEAQSGSTIGIRTDGDAAHSAGNYQYLVLVPAGQTAETPAQIAATLNKSLPPGNYWAAMDQTDMLGTASMTSAWTPEVPFSIVAPIVRPAAPTGFIAA